MQLRVLTGRRAGKVVAIVGQEFVVGSSRGCDLVLADEGVEARHAVLRTRPGAGTFIEDLGTDEGTFVAGRRIRGATYLEGSEELCFGRTYALLEPGAATRRSRRVPVSVAVAGVAGVALVATMVAVLLPRTGGGEEAQRGVPVLPVEPVREEAPAGEPPPPAPAETGKPAPAETAEPSGSDVEVRPPAVHEDFSDPQSGWEIVSAEAATGGYVDGEYVVDITSLGYYVTVDSGIETESPVVSLTARNPGRSASAGFGILCRYESEQDFVALVAGTDGTAAVLRRRDGTLSVISGNGSWAASADVPVNARSYRLRADCRRNTVALFVNGKRVVSARTALEPGHVGLFAAGRAEFRFDDVTITDQP